jgi:hypothetical protein
MATIVETTADEIRITDIVETNRRRLTNDGTGTFLKSNSSLLHLLRITFWRHRHHHINYHDYDNE